MDQHTPYTWKTSEVLHSHDSSLHADYEHLLWLQNCCCTAVLFRFLNLLPWQQNDSCLISPKLWSSTGKVSQLHQIGCLHTSKVPVHVALSSISQDLAPANPHPRIISPHIQLKLTERQVTTLTLDETKGKEPERCRKLLAVLHYWPFFWAKYPIHLLFTPGIATTRISKLNCRILQRLMPPKPMQIAAKIWRRTRLLAHLSRNVCLDIPPYLWLRWNWQSWSDHLLLSFSRFPLY